MCSEPVAGLRESSAPEELSRAAVLFSSLQIDYPWCMPGGPAVQRELLVVCSRVPPSDSRPELLCCPISRRYIDEKDVNCRGTCCAVRAAQACCMRAAPGCPQCRRATGTVHTACAPAAATPALGSGLTWTLPPRRCPYIFLCRVISVLFQGLRYTMLSLTSLTCMNVAGLQWEDGHISCSKHSVG